MSFLYNLLYQPTPIVAFSSDMNYIWTQVEMKLGYIRSTFIACEKFL